MAGVDLITMTIQGFSLGSNFKRGRKKKLNLF